MSGPSEADVRLAVKAAVARENERDTDQVLVDGERDLLDDD